MPNGAEYQPAPGIPLLTPLTRLLGGLAAEANEMALFVARTLRAALTVRPAWGEFFAQTVAIGWQTLPVLAAVAVFVGMNVALQAYGTFRLLGGESMLPTFSGLAAVRELCPSLAAAIIAAKAGTQIAAGLGTMRIREQIDALEVMAVDPYAYLVVPRLFAALVTVPAMVLIADAVALGSLYLVGVHQMGLDPGTFWTGMLDAIGMRDVVNGMLKGLFFATVIALVSCYYGFRATRGAEGVGRAANRAIVVCGVVMILGNMALTHWMYG